MSRFKWNRIALIALVFAGIGLCAPSALAYGSPAAGSPVKIHVLAFDDADAILVECDGRFGMVDSGEDSDSPTGDDARYPLRPGTTVGKGREREVIAYMESLGVNGDNFDFYIGTHPHSDHIGSADDIIRAFRPQAIYLPYYEDDFITSSSRLWDNLFVYDNLVAAAEWALASSSFSTTSKSLLLPNRMAGKVRRSRGCGSGRGHLRSPWEVLRLRFSTGRTLCLAIALFAFPTRISTPMG